MSQQPFNLQHYDPTGNRSYDVGYVSAEKIMEMRPIDTVQHPVVVKNILHEVVGIISSVFIAGHLVVSH